MDFYKECLVKKVLTSEERAKRYAAWGLISFILFALFVWGFILFNTIARLLAFVAVTYLVMEKYYFNKFLYKLSFKIEYEYTLTNTLLDIDKIVAQSERSRLLSFDIKEIELMTPMSLINSSEYDGKFKTIAEACEDLGDLENTYCIIAETEKYGRLRVVFTPDQGFIDVMAPMLGRRLRKQ